MDSRRERKKQETRQRLLEAAWELFREKGYDHTTVEEITETADVAKGTFFNYYPTKEAIVDQISLWRIELLGNRVLGADDVPESAVDRIKLLMKAMSDEFSPAEGVPGGGRELTRHMFLARISAPIKHESAHRIGSLMQELVVQGQANSEIRNDVEPGFVARLLMTCFFYHFVRWWHVSHPPRCRTLSPGMPGTGAGISEGLARASLTDEDFPAERSWHGDEAKLMQAVDVLMSGLAAPAPAS